MTFVIITGGIDLSVGSVVGLTSMIAGYLVLYGIDPGLGWSIQFNTFEIMGLVCLMGIFVGWINGVLITRLNVAPFIATLGMLDIARGATLLLSGGRGHIWGMIVRAFVIGILSDGLIMMSVSSFWQMVIKGLVIVAAVAIDQAQSRLQERVALAQEDG